jgi:hypothetical protein
MPQPGFNGPGMIIRGLNHKNHCCYMHLFIIVLVCYLFIEFLILVKKEDHVPTIDKTNQLHQKFEELVPSKPLVRIDRIEITKFYHVITGPGLWNVLN